ncbi:hypothetical protein VaNZ11_007639, partial [Volvox africanus]
MPSSLTTCCYSQRRLNYCGGCWRGWRRHRKTQRFRQLLLELLYRVPMNLRGDGDDGDGDGDGDSGGGRDDDGDGDSDGGSDGGNGDGGDDDGADGDDNDGGGEEGSAHGGDGDREDGDGDGTDCSSCNLPGQETELRGCSGRWGSAAAAAVAAAVHANAGSATGAAAPATVAVTTPVTVSAAMPSTSAAAVPPAAADDDDAKPPARMLQGTLLAAILESCLPAVLICKACGGGGDGGDGGGGGGDGADDGDGGGGGGATARHSQAAAPGVAVLTGNCMTSASKGPDWRPDGPVSVWCVCSGVARGGTGTAAATVTADTATATAAAATSTPVYGGGRCGVATDGKALEGPHHGAVHVVLREVVEVKNTCPFGMRQVRRGGKGRLVSEFFISDRGPRQEVSPLWIPQLQLHMLATGCHSGLLLSRSATKGTTVFRILRDDDYLNRMLSILDRFASEYVRRGVRPPRDMFAHQPEYAAFLS